MAGEKIVLKPQLRDQFGNPSSAPQGSVTAKLEAPDGVQQLHVKPNPKAIGSYDIAHESTVKVRGGCTLVRLRIRFLRSMRIR